VNGNWKSLGLVRGEPRNGRVIAVQVSISDSRTPHFSFGVGVLVGEEPWKPTAFYQDRDLDEILGLLATARLTVLSAVVAEQEVLAGAMALRESEKGRRPDYVAEPNAIVNLETEGAGKPLRVTFADLLKAKGSKLAEASD
jgi:hypothetical protein